MKLLSVLALLPALTQHVSAFSSGTGSCFGGTPNIFGPHLQSFGFGPPLVVQTGSLAQGGLQLFLDDDQVPEGEEFFFTEGTDHRLRVTGQEEYKGIFIRLQANVPDFDVDTTAALVENTGLLGPANVCSDPIVGIVHNSAALKNNEGGTLRIDETGANIVLDVTIVNVLNETDSIYYYSQFVLKAVSAPTRSPTTAPSRSPSTSPSASPTSAPSAVPSPSPSSAPSPQPSSPPTRSPTSIPSGVPTRVPTSSPTREPTGGPTSNPTLDPTGLPTLSPSTGPTSNPTFGPTGLPTRQPTNGPTSDPTLRPTGLPTRQPTNGPTANPSMGPTGVPTRSPMSSPTDQPTDAPTDQPTKAPTDEPSRQPTDEPTFNPSPAPSPVGFCIAEGDACAAGQGCCGASVCVGVCSRFVPPLMPSKDDFIIGGDGRDRNAGGNRVRGLSSRRVRGSGGDGV